MKTLNPEENKTIDFLSDYRSNQRQEIIRSETVFLNELSKLTGSIFLDGKLERIDILREMKLLIDDYLASSPKL